MIFFNSVIIVIQDFSKGNIYYFLGHDRADFPMNLNGEYLTIY